MQKTHPAYPLPASMLTMQATLSNQNQGYYGSNIVCVNTEVYGFSSLTSHFDVVSSVVFHPTEPLLVTGSMDCTLKLWNLNNSQNRR